MPRILSDGKFRLHKSADILQISWENSQVTLTKQETLNLYLFLHQEAIEGWFHE